MEISVVSRRSHRHVPLARTFLALLVLTLCAAVRAQTTTVSCYCALDSEHSMEILQEFERKTGIRIQYNMDTEDNKTIGLVNKLISERSNPRCDVFWNNELAHTIRLKKLGILEPYVSPMAADIPAAYKDKEGYWTGFAARGRVLIYNTTMVQGELPKGLESLLDPVWNGRATMAKPVTGTTMTHVAALFSVWGETKTKEWLSKLQKSPIYWNRGNAQVMRDVAEGARAWGYTDTDDAYVAEIRGAKTAVVIPDQGEGALGTLIIPNSVAVIRGSKNLESAKKLVDYILSPLVEAKLAAGRSAQIPLHPGVPAPAHVLSLEKTRIMKVDWEAVAEALEKHGPYLNDLFEGAVEKPGAKTTTAVVVALVVLGLVIVIALGRKTSVR